MQDPEIFEDYGYQALLKEFLDGAETLPDEDEDVNMTQKFLKKREKMRDL